MISFIPSTSRHGGRVLSSIGSQRDANSGQYEYSYTRSGVFDFWFPVASISCVLLPSKKYDSGKDLMDEEALWDFASTDASSTVVG